MSTSVDTMKNFFNVLKLYAYDATADGVEVLDHAIRTTTHFAGLQDAVNNFVYDIANVTATAGATQSLLQNCGIVIGANEDFTADTGAVSGYNAGMGVVKNAQDIVPEDNVNLSELPLPAAVSTTYHSYTVSDGNTFTYTVTYPNDYLEVVDVATATPYPNGSNDYSAVQKIYLQAGQTYYSTDGNGQPILETAHSGEEFAPSILTMLRGIENYWLDESFKLAYDSFGLDFGGKNLNVMFGINADYGADTTPTEYPDWEAVFPIDSINIYISIDNRTSLDPNDPNGKESNTLKLYLDRVIAHEMTHAVMFGAGLFKKNMPEFFTEGVAELVHGADSYGGESNLFLRMLAENPSLLAESLSFEEGTGTIFAYPAGYAFLRYLCHQALPTNVVIGTGTAELFGYTGGEEIISGETTGSQINFGENIFGTTAAVGGDDLFVNSTAGTLIVRDARGKVLNFANETGTVTARSYVADTAGTIDGRNFSEREIIFGGDFSDNEIYAGNGGSQLWGGSYGNDNLIGGDGVDEFVAGVGCGSDSVFNADSNDVINLAATSLDQIATVNSNVGDLESILNLGFSDGSSLTVWSTPAQKLNFKLADGSAYSFDTSSTQWTKTK
ncbi:MAG: hypothetical protein IJ685_00645 [Selenomonadaceae bacterium]|nr:hypothetical protein [Selenomonadaceae bacterium]